jgi:hypothetical protein
MLMILYSSKREYKITAKLERQIKIGLFNKRSRSHPGCFSSYWLLAKSISATLLRFLYFLISKFLIFRTFLIFSLTLNVDFNQ